MLKWIARERESGHIDIYMNGAYVGTCGGDFPVHYLLKLLEDANAAQQSVQRTGGESGQQNLFSAGDTLPAKLPVKPPRR